jgi:alpha-1,3-mannosyltransferase
LVLCLGVQFYCWYFHTLPYLLWQSSSLPVVAKLAVVMAIEWAFNVFPATPASSAVLQVQQSMHYGSQGG